MAKGIIFLMRKHEYRSLYTILLSTAIIVFISINLSGSTIDTTKSELDQVESDWNKLNNAFIAVGIDNCGYWFPPDTDDRRKIEPNLPLTFEYSLGYVNAKYNEEKDKKDFGPWRIWDPLTTPVAYCESIPKDPFNPGNYYGYTTWLMKFPKSNIYHCVAVLYSPGPDRISNLPLPKLRKLGDDYFNLFSDKDSYASGAILSDQDLRFFHNTITPYLYDPTNGIKSSGDLLWLIDGNYTPYGWRRDHSWKWQYFTVSTNEETKSVNVPLSTSAHIPHPEKKYIPMPKSFYNQMKSIGIFSQTQPPELIDHNLDAVRNKLGKDYHSFYLHPHLLTAEELAVFGKWKQSNPKWWQAIDQFAPFNDNQEGINLPAQEVYTLLPLYGKCQLLLAAEEWNRIQYIKARDRIADLRSFLAYIYFSDREERIRVELTRLANEFEEVIINPKDTK